jgi:HEAT repeat protein
MPLPKPRKRLEEFVNAVEQTPKYSYILETLISRKTYNESLYPHIVEALQSNDSNVRVSFAGAIGEVGPSGLPFCEQLIEKISVRLTTEKDHDVILYSANSLVKIGPLVIEPIATAIREGRLHYAYGLGILANFGPLILNHLPVIIFLLIKGYPWARREAAEAIEAIGPPAHMAVPFLIEALSDSEKNVVKASMLALASIGPAAKDAVPTLVKLLRDRPNRNSTTVLSQLDDTGSLSQFELEIRLLNIRVLRHSSYNKESRYDLLNAIRCLEKVLSAIGSEAQEAIPVLLEMLADANPLHRRIAATLLGKIGSKEPAVTLSLCKSARDHSKKVRNASISSLNFLGIPAISIPSYLKELFQDFSSSQLIRSLASEELRLANPPLWENLQNARQEASARLTGLVDAIFTEKANITTLEAFYKIGEAYLIHGAKSQRKVAELLEDEMHLSYINKKCKHDIPNLFSSVGDIFQRTHSGNQERISGLTDVGKMIWKLVAEVFQTPK